MNPTPLDAFLAACGSTEPLRFGVGGRDDAPSETWTFRQPFVVIGRRPESDLMLDDWQVSRRHAYIQLIEGEYYCVDLGNRTGTAGGDPGERSGWLARDRPIWIGPYSVQPEWPRAKVRERRPRVGVTWELPGLAVGRKTWRMDRQLVLIGRSTACKVRIVEPDVSKFHCSLVLTPYGVWVVDLLGQSGVFVNDEPVRSARLDDGDEVRVGRQVLRARYDESPLPFPDTVRDVEDEDEDVELETAPGSPGVGLATLVSGPAEWPQPRADLPTLRLVHGPSTGQELATGREPTSGAIDPSINLLVHQFGLMQQQMMDQFHNTMMMMFEGFAALHREQSATIRQELDEVRKLSEDINALRAEIAKPPAPAPAPAPAPVPVPSPAPAPVPTPAPAAGRVADRPRPAPSARPAPGVPSAPREPIKRATPPPPEGDIHAQLCRKLASIQAERQTRWQKIMGMLSGLNG